MNKLIVEGFTGKLSKYTDQVKELAYRKRKSCQKRMKNGLKIFKRIFYNLSVKNLIT